MFVLLGLASVLCVAAVIWRPALGAYLLLATTPALAGLARGSIPLRPNEMLLLLVLAALGLRNMLLMLCRHYRLPSLDQMDLALLGMVGASLVLPLVVCVVRGLTLTRDDVLYAMVLAKYYALYRVFRSTIVAEAQVRVCLWLSMCAAAVTSVVAVLQVLHLFGVAEFLMTYYDTPFEGFAAGAIRMMTDRGSSTLASTFATADVAIMNIVISLALCRTAQRSRWLLVTLALFCLSGCIVAAEFSGYLGLLVALLVFGAMTRTLRKLLPIGTLSIAAAVIPFWTVIQHRLAGFNQPSGMPHSWTGRWENLERFFFPRLGGLNWLFGVQPAPRVLAPETWRQFVYLESGYLSLLWSGGLPLVLAFGFFTYVAGRWLYRVARRRRDSVGVAAIAGFSYFVAVLVLMLLDPHLTVRGSADLFFPLIAMSLADPAVRQETIMPLRGPVRSARAVSLLGPPRPAQTREV